MAIGRDGEVDLAFGEGPNYAGPGNIWFARSSGMQLRPGRPGAGDKFTASMDVAA
ncbi:MAG: hypothetical protein M3003_04605 [Candidatus Dormibacteraeota bacterium]|nr:hypothetical protein [Candidatus Dormibacteraeota bacterium]